MNLEDDQPYAPTALSMDQALHEAVLTYLIASAPLEGVGLLAVSTREGVNSGCVRAVRFYPGTNIDASPARYTMDPEEVLNAFRDIEAHGWRLGAIVHSHPATPAIPSATDLREAHYPDALMVIVSLARHPPETRAWRITPGLGPDHAGSAATEVTILVEERFDPT